MKDLSHNGDHPRTVVVTGSSGLLGKHVVNELLNSTNVKVRKVDLKDDGTGETKIVDLSTSRELDEIFADATSLVHCAGIPRPGLYDELQILTKNIEIAYHAVSAAERNHLSSIVNASSVSVYGYPFYVKQIRPESFPLTEAEKRAPQDAYGLSKLAVEELCNSYARAYNINVTHLRFPWIQTQDTFFSDRSAARSSGFDIANLWAYIDARDAAMAIRLSLTNDCQSGQHIRVFNVSAMDNSDGQQTATLINRQWPNAGAAITSDKSIVSYERAGASLGFFPRYSWKEYKR